MHTGPAKGKEVRSQAALLSARADLATAWEVLGKKKSFWGGVSEATHVHMGSEETVRQSVRNFYETCGPRGTILAAVSTFQPQDPVANIHAMIDEWKQVRDRWIN